MTAMPAQSKPQTRRWLRIAIAISTALLAVAVFRAISWRSPQSAAVVLTRAQLELIDGTLREKGRPAPFTGVMIEHYEGGVLKSRSSIQGGRLHGPSEGWHTNGQLQVVEHFISGVSHGSRTKWHANGRKLSEASIVEGKLHGVFSRWAEDGSLAEVIEMKDGEPHGVSRAYYPSGCVKAEVMLSHGRVLQTKHWQDGEYKLTGALARSDHQL